MTIRKLGAAAAIALTLGVAGAAQAAPFAAQPLGNAGLPVETVQWGHGNGHHYGWRHHHRGPRCWTERIVHRTPWGPRVDYRRICR